MQLISKDDGDEKNYERFEAFFSTLACLRFDDVLRTNDETHLKKIIYFLMDDVQSNIVEQRFTVLLARTIESDESGRFTFGCSSCGDSSWIADHGRSRTTKQTR